MIDERDRAALRMAAVAALRPALIALGVGTGALFGALALGLAARVFGAASGLW